MRFSFFPAFFGKPDNIAFADQELNENVELMLRQHFITNIPWIVIALFAFALPAILLNLDQRFQANLFIQIPFSVILGALIIWYLLVVAYVLENFLYWYFNVYIVTNLHLVDINFYSLLYRDITSVQLDDVQSVSSRIAGIFGSLFNFGDVVVETAAKRQLINFGAVPKPDVVADRIQDLQEKIEQSRGSGGGL